MALTVDKRWWKRSRVKLTIRNVQSMSDSVISANQSRLVNRYTTPNDTHAHSSIHLIDRHPPWKITLPPSVHPDPPALSCHSQRFWIIITMDDREMPGTVWAHLCELKRRALATGSWRCRYHTHKTPQKHPLWVPWSTGLKQFKGTQLSVVETHFWWRSTDKRGHANELECCSCWELGWCWHASVHTYTVEQIR